MVREVIEDEVQNKKKAKEREKMNCKREEWRKVDEVMLDIDCK